MKFKAFKMDGLGNDFLIIDNRNQKISLNPEQILKLSNREKGIGFDQLIYIENSTQADAEIKYFNSDGQMADACGNGNRCISDILIKEKTNIDIYLSMVSGDCYIKHGHITSIVKRLIRK